MKPLFYTKTLIAIAVAIAAAATAVGQAQEQPIPPPAVDNALPANIIPGSPLSEVVKMVRAGVDITTIQNYIATSPGAFNLDTDKILFLKDEGVPNDLINAMMDRDKALYASSAAPPPAMVNTVPPPMSAPGVTTEAPPATEVVAPPAEITVDYFNDSLTPYGTWVNVEGYGRCWRPTVTVYDSSWRPYCDRGHWAYTDYGWYWDSDYSWGATFHYGRWFNHAGLGWCWYPDTVWSPSWVTWRSGGEYCGWAPLPPFAVFRPGAGFYFRGASVGVNFDFGLDVNCFVFLSPDHFCDRHVASFCAPRGRAAEIFHQTTIINNYNVNNRMIVNRGFGTDRIAAATHHPIEPVHVSGLANAGNQGWRGEGYKQTLQRSTAFNNSQTTAFHAVHNTTVNNNAGGNNNNYNNNYGHAYSSVNNGNNQGSQNTGSYNNGNNTTTAVVHRQYAGQSGALPQNGFQADSRHVNTTTSTTPTTRGPMTGYNYNQSQNSQNYVYHQAGNQQQAIGSQTVQTPHQYVQPAAPPIPGNSAQQHGGWQIQQHETPVPSQPTYQAPQGQGQSQPQGANYHNANNNGAGSGSNGGSGNGSSNGSNRNSNQNH